MMKKKELNYDFCFNKSVDPIKYVKRRIKTHHIKWYCISYHQKLSEEFIREFKKNKVSWNCISRNQKLSEDFIREFQIKVNWNIISCYQELSESFIREFHYKVDWYYISQYQKLSEEFIREFQYEVIWWYISKYQQLSEEFIKEFQDKLNLKLIEDNWIYKSSDYKKQQVEATGLYECHDDYFICYKGIRSNRYSKYNFQYQYLTGETYSSWADYSDNENSFGLSVWTKEKASNYCNQLVVTCKVYYEDVARVVHKGGKIRCSKINILD